MVYYGENKKPLGYDIKGNSKGCKTHVKAKSISKNRMSKELTQTDVSEIIQMALADDVSFEAINLQYGLSEDSVKKLMKKNITNNSYKHWRKRVKLFSERRKYYK
jgi:uncharacterized protein (TIGR03643 family)